MHETNNTSLAGEKEVTWESWRWGNYTSHLQSRKRELRNFKTTQHSFFERNAPFDGKVS